MRFYKKYYYVDRNIDWDNPEGHHWRNIIQIKFERVQDPKESWYETD